MKSNSWASKQTKFQFWKWCNFRQLETFFLRAFQGEKRSWTLHSANKWPLVVLVKSYKLLGRETGCSFQAARVFGSFFRRSLGRTGFTGSPLIGNLGFDGFLRFFQAGLMQWLRLVPRMHQLLGAPFRWDSTTNRNLPGRLKRGVSKTPSGFCFHVLTWPSWKGQDGDTGDSYAFLE